MTTRNEIRKMLKGSMMCAFFAVVSVPHSRAGECDLNFGGQTDKGTVSYSGVTELSGIAASRRNSNVYYVQNDNSGSVGIIALSGSANFLGLYTLPGFSAGDWEDIAVGPGPSAGVNYVYVGNIGDNSAQYATRKIARVPEPVVSDTQSPVTNALSGVEIITYQYADGARDAETLMVDSLTKDIYLVTKRESQVRVYRLPYPQSTTSTMTAEYVTTLNLYWTVGGDISPSGSGILIKTGGTAYHWCRSAGQTVGQALSAAPVQVPYTAEPQGEAICWRADGLGYFTISEGVNPHLYFYPSLADAQAPVISIATPAASPFSATQAQVAVAGIATDNVAVTAISYRLSGDTSGTGACSLLDNTLVAEGSTWKYLANGVDQGAAWRANGFNDSAWSSGAAELGYGDGDEATVISYGGDVSNKYMTTYFRKSFTVQDASVLTSPLTLNVRRDDGVIVYVNGTEVFRDNLPAGTVSYSTPASVTMDGTNEEAFLTASVPAGLLVNGANVVAVEMHQRTAASSDLSFDLSLRHAAAAGSWSTPALSLNEGSTWVSVTARDAAGNTNTATVQVDFDGGPVNLPPTAANDGAYETDEDDALHVGNAGVLANDLDPEGAALSAQLVSGAAHGTVSLNSDGTFDYYPQADFHGSDSFTYRAFDGSKSSTVATVSLDVQAVNDLPSAQNVSVLAFRGKAVELELPGSDADGDALSCEILSYPSNGTLDVVSSCTVQYTAGTNDGPDGFSFRLTDGQGVSLPATVSLDVRHALGGGFFADGDDKAELAVYDRTRGDWSVKCLVSGAVLVSNKNWGSSGMDPVHGDYDGDGISDLAVYERATGNWFIRDIADGSGAIAYALNWGSKNMDPVPGDYDGDGKFDLAAYERTTGKWYIRRTDDSAPIAFGQSYGYKTMIPVPGDYDGDGVWDMAIYEKRYGVWFIRSMKTGESIAGMVFWGSKNCDPVPGDYDGDGIWDLAVYERTTGKWSIRKVTGEVICSGKSFGSASTKPVAGDYNGDGQCDLAIYEKNNGLWFVQDLKTDQTLVYSEKWGSSTMSPVSASK